MAVRNTLHAMVQQYLELAAPSPLGTKAGDTESQTWLSHGGGGTQETDPYPMPLVWRTLAMVRCDAQEEGAGMATEQLRENCSSALPCDSRGPGEVLRGLCVEGSKQRLWTGSTCAHRESPRLWPAIGQKGRNSATPKTRHCMALPCRVADG